MQWANGPLILYHGTDDLSAKDIIDNGADEKKSDPLSDFGLGFYLTTWLKQAKNWANVRCRRLPHTSPAQRPTAVVVRFEVSREELALARPEVLVFVTEGSNPDYWNLVEHCRQGRSGGHLLRGGYYYDLVYGPVSLWPQTLVIKDCDQISFHNPRNLELLSKRREEARGNPWFS